MNSAVYLFYLKIPVLMIVSFQGFNPVGCAIDGRVGDVAHQLRQGSTVITFSVVGNNEIDPAAL